MLTGNDLVLVHTQMIASGRTITEIARACGYEIDGKVKYTKFYEELLRAKGQIIDETEDETVEIPEEVSEDNRELYLELCESHSEDALKAYSEVWGYDSLDMFEERYYGHYSSEAEFAEDFTHSTWDMQVPSYVVIDWQATWDRNLRHDFYFEDGYVFHNV